MVESIKQAFILPKDKIMRFLELREYLLSCSELEVRSLQRFAGKCISFLKTKKCCNWVDHRVG